MTAKNILEEWLSQTDQTNLKQGHYFVIEEAMKEYAKMKCKELLEIAAEKCLIEEIHKRPIDGSITKRLSYAFGGENTEYTINKDSILNAVNLNEFIK